MDIRDLRHLSGHAALQHYNFAITIPKECVCDTSAIYSSVTGVEAGRSQDGTSRPAEKTIKNLFLRPNLLAVKGEKCNSATVNTAFLKNSLLSKKKHKSFQIYARVEFDSAPAAVFSKPSPSFS